MLIDFTDGCIAIREPTRVLTRTPRGLSNALRAQQIGGTLPPW